jgi:hypothetical protein
VSTLDVVEVVLRAARVPLSAQAIVVRAGARLPSKSQRPDYVVARDLALDLRKLGARSRFARTAPGRYTLREFVDPAETYDVAPQRRSPWTWTPQALTRRRQRT